jgi:hypothetical protein
MLSVIRTETASRVLGVDGPYPMKSVICTAVLGVLLFAFRCGGATFITV